MSQSLLVTRRSLLKRTVAAGVAIPAVGPVIAACIQSESKASVVNNQPGPVFDPAFAYENLDIDHLDQILPVIRSGAAEAATVTLNSLELYEAGFNAVLVIDWEDETNKPFPAGGSPVVSAQDDRGNQYQGVFQAGHGDGDGRIGMIHNFEPALDPAAQSLTFTFQWVATPFEGSEQTGMVFSENDIVAGPWSVTIPIDQQPSSGSPSDSERDLNRVMPVAQVQEASGFSISLMSIEMYRDRFIMLGRMDWTAEPDQYMPMPELIWEARDDQENEYQASGSSVLGGGPPPDQEAGIWPRSSRITAVFKPGIAGDTRTLTLQISEIRMVRQIPDGNQLSPELVETVTGPWRFAADL